MKCTPRERERIRSLAERVIEIAHEPRMVLIKRRWADVNALRKPDRAPVWCKPVGCWREIIPQEALVCEDEWLRSLEYCFLQILHKRDIGDDTPVEDHLAINAVFRPEPANVWGVDILHERPDVQGGAWKYDPPLKTEADFDRLRMPSFTYDAATTDELMDRSSELLDGVMPVKLTARQLLSETLGTAAADLRGLETMMMDMATEPELMHRLMAYLRDAVLSTMDQVETTGLLALNNHGAMTCSDPIGETGNGSPTFANLWCMANSQEFDQVSPAMWEEFCLDYQKPIFERFGLVGYGCCENLTRKIDGVLSIPNLRIFVCSAWTDLAAVQEKVGQDYCIMWRQKAGDVVFPDDSGQVRDALMEGARQLRGNYYQIVLRELQTLVGHPRRLHEWTQHATTAAEKYASTPW